MNFSAEAKQKKSIIYMSYLLLLLLSERGTNVPNNLPGELEANGLKDRDRADRMGFFVFCMDRDDSYCSRPSFSVSRSRVLWGISHCINDATDEPISEWQCDATRRAYTSYRGRVSEVMFDQMGILLYVSCADYAQKMS